jgi:NADH-quinone oxidoreductase subunit C
MLPESLQKDSAAQAIAALVPHAIQSGHCDRDEPTLIISPAEIVLVCRLLKTEEGFVRLSGITAVDWHPADPRFEVVYLLHSLSKNRRLRLKCQVSESDCAIDSVTSVWRSAGWYEREVFDLFGIKFRNHPDLRRLMMPTDWEGHPLRKDYPIHGHKYSYQNE